MQAIRFGLLLFMLCNTTCCQASIPKIVVSITPFYQLSKVVFAEKAQIDLFVPPYQSPHNYQLKPNDLKKLYQSNIIIWGGDVLEPVLSKVLKQLPNQIQIVDLSKTPGLQKLQNNSHTYDPHFWLSPSNAIAILKNLGYASNKQFSESTRNQIAKNIDHQIEKIQTSSKIWQIYFKTHQLANFAFFHDAYKYFEKNFNIHATSIINIHPEIPSTAQHQKNFLTQLENNQIQCIYREPQFDAHIIDLIKIKYPHVKILILDPIGVPSQTYEALINQLASQLTLCQK